MEIKKHVPVIRFKDFSEEWVERELGSNFKFQYGFYNNNPSDGGIYPVYGANGIIGGYSKYNAEDSIIIGHMGEYAGSVAWAKGKHFVTYNGIITSIINNQIYPQYGYHLFVQLDLRKLCGGSGQPFLSYNVLEKLKIRIPYQKDEQIQIGNYFKQLDEMIRLQDQNHEKLTQLKKAMLEKMFLKEGADVPEIRFKFFTDKWEEKKLGEIAKIIGGGTPSTSNADYWNGDIDWYSPTEIGQNVYANGSEKKITQLGLEKSSATILPAKRSILFTSRAGIGDMAILMREGATNQGFQSLVLNTNYDTYFIYSMGHLIKEFALKYSSGSTFLEISGKVLAKMPIRIPTLQEQQKIGLYFQNLDKLIVNSRLKIDKLKKVKQTLLDKMFI